MRNLKELICVFAFVVASFTVATAEDIPVDGGKILSTYRNALVNLVVSYIDSKGIPGCKTGTGFIIANSGYVITSKHLLVDTYNQPPQSTPIIYGSVGNKFELAPNGLCQVVGTVKSLGIVQKDPNQDVALLKLPAETTYDYIPACRQTKILPSEHIVKLGFPKDLPLQPAEGSVAALDGPAGMWQINMAVNDGDSGSPVFNKFGRVIGLIYGDTKNANNISWIVPLQYFQSMYAVANAPLVDCTTSSGALEAAGCEPNQQKFPVDDSNAEHGGLKESSRDASFSFAAKDERVIQSYIWVPNSVNNARGPYFELSPDRKVLKMIVSLSSGPLFDQYRGWINGVVVTNEVAPSCLKR
jgi:hypothetical protein